MDHRTATRRFYLRVAASTLIPGAGLIPTRRAQGTTLVATVLATLAGAGVFLTLSPTPASVLALDAATNPTFLAYLPLAIVAFALSWIGAIVLTALDNAPSPQQASRLPRAVMAAFAAATSMLVAAPAAQAARYADIQHDVVTSVFATAGPDGQPLNRAPRRTVEDLGKSSLRGRINVLLIGSDAGDGRVGVRPDSTIVASIDTATGDATLMGIPRNLQNVPFPPSSPLHAIYPEGYNCGSECLFNAIWTEGENRAALYPDTDRPGLAATREAASATLGVPIHHSVILDLAGFTELVDAMGGVDINVTERVCIGCKAENGAVVGTTGWIEPGVQHLNGYRALWYARSRAGSSDGDYSRMGRQRCIVGAIVDQVDPLEMLARYPALAKVLQNNLATDIPAQDLPAFAALVLKVQREGQMNSLPLTPKNTNILAPDIPAIHAMVDEALYAPRPVITPAAPPRPSATATPETADTADTAETAGDQEPGEAPEPVAPDLAATC